jgi:hypothetical protein
LCFFLLLRYRLWATFLQHPCTFDSTRT